MNGVGAHEVVIESAGPRPGPGRPAGRAHRAGADRLPRARARPASRPALALRADLQEPRRPGRAPRSSTRTRQLIATPIIPKQHAGGAGGRAALLRAQGALRVLRHRAAGDRRERRPARGVDERALRGASSRSRRASRSRPGSCRAATTPSFQVLDDAGEFRELATACSRTRCTRLNRALDRPPFNFVLHTAPVSDDELEYYHWHIEIMPKLTRVAGFEIGSGFYINPTPPEDAAQYLREIAVEADGLVHEPRRLLRSRTSRSEMTPIAKVGGLWRDVVGALATSRRARGHRVIGGDCPRYRALAIRRRLDAQHALGTLEVPWGHADASRPPSSCCAAAATAAARLARAAGRITSASAASSTGRASTTTRARRRGYPDNARALPVLRARARCEGSSGSASRSTSCTRHDHQAGVGAVLRCARTRPRSARSRGVATGVHDPQPRLPGHPRSVGAGARRASGASCSIPPSPFEFWGRVNYMKVGLAFADLISHREPALRASRSRSAGEFGFGLEGVLRAPQRRPARAS